MVDCWLEEKSSILFLFDDFKPGQHSVGVFHIALIMDGNGRWATQKGRPRWWGHRKGAQVLERVLGACKDHNVTHVTVYAFSPDNWGREAQEVQSLMALFQWYLTHRTKKLIQEKIQLKIMGDRSILSPSLQTSIALAEEATRHFSDLVLSVALNYGGQEDMVQAIQQLVRSYQDSAQDPATISASTVQDYLWTRHLPDPDLLIRTGGEIRLSNFMLWSLRYTECLFLPVLWPDFTPQDLAQAVAVYRQRHRRFGRINTTPTKHPESDLSTPSFCLPSRSTECLP